MTTTFTTNAPSSDLQAPIFLSEEEIMLVAGGFSLNPLHYIESGAKAIASGAKATLGAVTAHPVDAVMFSIVIGMVVAAALA
jgi:hypothetical protein